MFFYNSGANNNGLFSFRDKIINNRLAGKRDENKKLIIWNRALELTSLRQT